MHLFSCKFCGVRQPQNNRKISKYAIAENFFGSNLFNGMEPNIKSFHQSHLCYELSKSQATYEQIPRPYGLWQGKVQMSDDFDILPDAIASAFAGEME